MLIGIWRRRGLSAPACYPTTLDPDIHRDPERPPSDGTGSRPGRVPQPVPVQQDLLMKSLSLASLIGISCLFPFGRFWRPCLSLCAASSSVIPGCVRPVRQPLRFRSLIRCPSLSFAAVFSWPFCGPPDAPLWPARLQRTLILITKNGMHDRVAYEVN